MFSPLTLIKIFEVLESVFICLFPIALVTSITLTGILIYLGAFVFLVLFILKRKENFRNMPWHVSAFIIYILTFTLSKSINSGVLEGFNTFIRCSQDYFVFLWILFFVSRNNGNEKLIKNMIFFASVISVFYGLMQFFHFDIFHRQINIERLSGFHKNPYSYGGQLIIVFFFLLSALNAPFKQLSSLLILIACFFCILNTSERAVILGVLLGLLFYFLLQKEKTKNVLAFTLLLAIPFIITSIFNAKVFKRVRNAVLPQKGSSPNVRVKLWQMALSIWKRNMLFGSGKFPTVYHEIPGAFSPQILTHAHNVYLQILVTNGIVGLIAYLNLFFSMLKILFSSLRFGKNPASLIAVIFAFFVEGIFEYFWGDSEVRYFLLFFSGFVFGSIVKEEKEEQEQASH